MTGRLPQGEAPSPARDVRRHDPDRFLMSLFLPADLRDAAWTLIAFNHELARAIESGHRRDGAGRDEAIGHTASLVRLQWWREIVDGRRPPAERARHAVAASLGALLDAGTLDADRLAAMIDAREAELDGLPDLAAWCRNLLDGPGNLAHALGALGGADAASLDALARAGAAYGAGASLRHRAALAAVGRAPFPADTPDPAILAARAAAEFLPPPRRWLAPALAPALHGVLARRDLARLRAGREEPGPRGAGDRLAVLIAWARRRA